MRMIVVVVAVEEMSRGIAVYVERMMMAVVVAVVVDDVVVVAVAMVILIGEMTRKRRMMIWCVGHPVHMKVVWRSGLVLKLG